MSEGRRGVVVTVPRDLWWEWLAEGDLPDEEPSGAEYHYFMRGPLPDIRPGARVYVVSHNRLRGYAPLVRIEYPTPENAAWWWGGATFALVRGGGAVAVTIDAQIRGFRGWRYPWWDEADERPFPNWRAEDVKR